MTLLNHSICKNWECQKPFYVDINVPDDLWDKIRNWYGESPDRLTWTVLEKNDVLCPRCIIDAITRTRKEDHASFHLIPTDEWQRPTT